MDQFSNSLNVQICTFLLELEKVAHSPKQRCRDASEADAIFELLHAEFTSNWSVDICEAEQARRVSEIGGGKPIHRGLALERVVRRSSRSLIFWSVYRKAETSLLIAATPLFGRPASPLDLLVVYPSVR